MTRPESAPNGSLAEVSFRSCPAAGGRCGGLPQKRRRSSAGAPRSFALQAWRSLLLVLRRRGHASRLGLFQRLLLAGDGGVGLGLVGLVLDVLARLGRGALGQRRLAVVGALALLGHAGV